MWIVKLALRRPYTFVITAILIVVLGVVTILRMPVDIFPEINIPVVSVIWTYGGVAPEEMEQRIVTINERAYTTTVNDIEHIESQSLNGVSVIKVFFQPGAKVEAAVAQLTSITQTLLRIMPPGITPPLIIRYNASSVPVLQMSVSSKSLSEQELYDNGNNFLRTQLATIQGASVPLPYGGKPRQIMVDIDPQALFAKGLSATDVTTAINAQNLILPAGNAKLGEREYTVRLNSSPEVIDALNNLPIKEVNNTVIYIRDVAQVHDGFAVQTNIVRRDGRRSSLISVLKNGGASTLDVVARVKEALPRIKATLPKELNIDLLFDQSIFVKASIQGVLTEGLIAACLTAAMILLFLGSWRSTLIVAISIPLSILCSIIIMRALGQTLNIMTLGGLSLAVGILVDDATVEIENIHRNLGQGKPLQTAILDGAQQIAVPALVSTLAICIVFVPIVFLSGVAQSLFMPLGMAVVFAMLASYLLSRTVVPMMANFLLGREVHLYVEHDSGHETNHDIFWRLHQRFNANVQGRDLGSVANSIYKVVGEYKRKLPRGSSIIVRGQVETMNTSFLGLGVGLIFAIALVYCLMVVNFQSWVDPFIIMMALPNALAGIIWILFVTNTTLSVPSLMGAIMSIGVATANSILLVTFANDQRLEGEKAKPAALSAGYTRLRPVLMTAGAMIMGMLPMSLGLGEGGEQNAPLGRAVIGGLLAATSATLIFVPVVYSMLRRKQPRSLDEETPVVGIPVTR